MNDGVTSRIEALEARGYVLHKNDEFAKAGEWFPWEDRLDESLTALEQAEAELAAFKDAGRMYATGYFMAQTIGAARLKLEKQRAERWKFAAHEALWHMNENEQRAEQAEAALAAEREKQARRLNDPKKGEWKRKYFQSRAALDAERAKRCVHAVASTCPFYFAESTSSNQVPNVAQQGSERDAEGTGEASE